MNEQRRKKSIVESLEYSDNVPSRPLSSATMGGSAMNNGNGGPARTSSPGQESGADPPAARHAPATGAQRVLEKGKYESTAPFRSPKGDRFS